MISSDGSKLLVEIEFQSKKYSFEFRLKGYSMKSKVSLAAMDYSEIMKIWSIAQGELGNHLANNLIDFISMQQMDLSADYKKATFSITVHTVDGRDIRLKVVFNYETRTTRNLSSIQIDGSYLPDDKNTVLAGALMFMSYMNFIAAKAGKEMDEMLKIGFNPFDFYSQN